MHWADLYQSFNNATKTNTSSDLDSYTSILANLIRNQGVRSLLDEIIYNEKLLQEVSQTSYTHENGFDKLIIMSSAEKGWRLRIHIWQTNYSRKSEYDIHNHSWNYASSILVGAIRNVVYEHTEEGTSYYKHLYEIDNETCISRLTFLKKAYLKASASSKKFVAGDTYSQNQNTLHQVLPIENQVVATLVLQQQSTKLTSEVYKTSLSHGEQHIGLSNKLLSSSDLKDKLQQLKNKLEEGII